MLNTKRNINNNVYNGSKSRSKSIYRGDQSHTLSMHLKIDNEVSPDKIRNMPDLHIQHKYSHKQNKIQAFRDSLKINEPIYLGKRTDRDNIQIKSSKKLTNNILQTQRPLKQSVNISYRKQSSKIERIQKQKQKSVGSSQISQVTHVRQKSQFLKQMDSQQIAINYDQFKSMLSSMKKLADQNHVLKKQLNFLLKNKGNSNSIVKALVR